MPTLSGTIRSIGGNPVRTVVKATRTSKPGPVGDGKFCLGGSVSFETDADGNFSVTLVHGEFRLDWSVGGLPSRLNIVIPEGAETVSLVDVMAPT
ncbi:MAG: hypothetical protein KF833_00780 [Verrucomicrobiae bacterium]|nr:hypothetical protein [Verrucomicrobiae bacterium]